MGVRFNDVLLDLHPRKISTDSSDGKSLPVAAEGPLCFRRPPSRSMQRTRVPAASRCARAPFISLETSRCCTQVCLSAPSAGLGFRVIPALGTWARQFQAPFLVSVSLPDCRLRLLQIHQTICFRTLRKTDFAWFESGPLCSGSPQPIGARKEDNKCFAKIASLSSVF